MKELTREQLKFMDDSLELANKTNRVDYQMLFYEQLMKEHKQKMQLVLVNDLLDKMEHLANLTNRVDYDPSYEEAQKILQIKRYADAVLKNIE